MTQGVRNAIWNCILEALICDTKDGPKTYNIKETVLQCLVLDRLLWNITYDAVIKLHISADMKTNGFADDVAVVMLANYLEEATQMANQAVAIRL